MAGSWRIQRGFHPDTEDPLRFRRQSAFCGTKRPLRGFRVGRPAGMTCPWLDSQEFSRDAKNRILASPAMKSAGKPFSAGHVTKKNATVGRGCVSGWKRGHGRAIGGASKTSTRDRTPRGGWCLAAIGNSAGVLERGSAARKPQNYDFRVRSYKPNIPTSCRTPQGLPDLPRAPGNTTQGQRFSPFCPDSSSQGN